jgi:hypothetical protein
MEHKGFELSFRLMESFFTGISHLIFVLQIGMPRVQKDLKPLKVLSLDELGHGLKARAGNHQVHIGFLVTKEKSSMNIYHFCYKNRHNVSHHTTDCEQQLEINI